MSQSCFQLLVGAHYNITQYHCRCTPCSFSTPLSPHFSYRQFRRAQWHSVIPLSPLLSLHVELELYSGWFGHSSFLGPGDLGLPSSYWAASQTRQFTPLWFGNFVELSVQKKRPQNLSIREVQFAAPLSADSIGRQLSLTRTQTLALPLAARHY